MSIHATQGDALAFDRIERGRHGRAPACRTCGRPVVSAGLRADDLIFCVDCGAEPRRHRMEEGRVGWLVLWLLGIPIPVLLVLYFLRGCT